MTKQNLITHQVQNVTVLQRESDGYLNATKLAQAAGKRWANYLRNDNVEAFVKALEAETQIRVSELIQTVKGGNGEQGTWIHPLIAINLAQWLSPEFAVKVSQWVYEWMGQGKKPDPEFVMIHKSVLDNTGKALVWMGDYGVTSQPYYGGAQPPFIDGRPALLSDNSTRYYLSKYVGNTMEAQTLVTEDCLTQHVRNQFPALEVVHRETMHTHLMQIASNITALSGQFSTYAETKKRFTTATDNFLART